MKRISMAMVCAALACACGKGTMGDVGPSGPAGTAGSAASVRFTLISASESKGAFAACPMGSQIVGGSCTCTPASAHVSQSTTFTNGPLSLTTSPAAGLPGFHLCKCDGPSSLTDWTATAQATCVDGTGATVVVVQ